MKTFSSGKLGKTVVIELDRGDKIIEKVCEALNVVGIENAVIVSAVGSIQKLVYHRPTDMGITASDEFVTVERPMEIGALTGSVFSGIPHFHIVAADLEEVFVGHLEYGSETMYLMEIIMTEVDNCELERRLTPENVKKLFIKSCS